MKKQFFTKIGRVSIFFSLSLVLFGCAKEGSQDPKSKGVSPDVVKTEMRQKFPELAEKCLEIAKSFEGRFASWDFSVDHWNLKDSDHKYSNQEMVDAGYSITYRLYPSDVRVSFDATQKQLITTLNTGTKNKVVVWDVFPNANGKCVLFHDLNQEQTLLNDWVIVELAPEADGSQSLKAPFQWYDQSERYKAFGEIHFQR